MRDFLLKLGICYLVAMDDDTLFKGAFTAACDSLQLKYECVSRGNYKVVLVDKFHRFLNKTVTIAVQKAVLRQGMLGTARSLMGLISFVVPLLSGVS